MRAVLAVRARKSWENGKPVRETRAIACLSLAKTLQHEADSKPESAGPATDQEIVALLKRVTDEFSDVKLEGHQPIGVYH